MPIKLPTRAGAAAFRTCVRRGPNPRY
ncbi:hypothetical protein SEA_TRAX_128 [Gordonia phage Trax]|uniref:Uncharacterized protein n=1 Tax=Gordonia phage Trax TaxID=2591121 RepID=A0A515MH62_9CAUD|nr:hypothetical protein L3Y20_gp104 [Gordonia phage Trax]QDM56008.1 hypothetical protein SEA_TRAX_128 [Gordonia phage Trax]